MSTTHETLAERPSETRPEKRTQKRAGVAPAPILPAAFADETDCPAEHEAFLWCRIGVVDYAVPARDLLEIRNWEMPTPLSDGASSVRGVISLRGQILPVVDLRHRLQMGPEVGGASQVILIARVGDRTLGLVVDDVLDFLVLDPSAILPAPAVGATLHAEHMIGLAAQAQGMVILLRLDGLLRGCGLID